jgi:hypothetical protein
MCEDQKKPRFQFPPGTGLLLMYLFALRPWMLRWGATENEARRTLPGDDEVPNPMWQTTRAVTINAPPDQTWPWLVQMGYERAGFYSYDRLDNAGIPSAATIIPELQNVKVGDPFLLEADTALEFTRLEPEQTMVCAGHDLRAELGLRFDASAAYVLEPLDTISTRLIARFRANLRGPLARVYTYVFFEPVDFIMMRKQLLGIKERAERLAAGG